MPSSAFVFLDKTLVKRPSVQDAGQRIAAGGFPQLTLHAENSGAGIALEPWAQEPASIRAMSTPRLMGFETKSSAPAASPSTRSSELDFAVKRRKYT